MNISVKARSFRLNFISSLFRYSTSPAEIVETNDQVIINDDDEAALAKEAEIERKRNISRLSEAHYKVVNGKRPYAVPKSLTHLTVKYNRKMYGKYGAASGVNPSLCFPTREDIQEKMEYESVAYPFTIQEMIDTAAQKRKEEQEKIEARENEIAAKMLKLEQWKKDLADRIAKKEKDAKVAKEKKERLVEEVRRHFGFKLDPRDERFQEMLAKREKEQKKLEKMAKKEAKEKVMLAKLQEKNAQMSTKA